MLALHVLVVVSDAEGFVAGLFHFFCHSTFKLN